MTALVPAGSPARAESGSHGLGSSASAKQKLTLPGKPWLARSARPGFAAPTLARARRTARPTVRFVRPEPMQPAPLSNPSSWRTAPLTTISTVAGLVVFWIDRGLKAGSTTA